MLKRRTMVCRTDECGGGWWGETVPVTCPRCGGALTELAPTIVIPLREEGHIDG